MPEGNQPHPDDDSMLARHRAHLERVSADIASDEARLAKLTQRIGRRSALGLSLPGTNRLRAEASGLDAALRFTYVEEAHTQLDVAREQDRP